MLTWIEQYCVNNLNIVYEEKTMANYFFFYFALHFYILISASEYFTRRY